MIEMTATAESIGEISFKNVTRPLHTAFVHCSASDRPEHDDVSVMDNWHKARGWSGVGYHAFIRKDGLIQLGRDWDRTPAGQYGHNSGSLAFCLHGLAIGEFTQAQFNSLIALADSCDEVYGPLKWRGHKEVSNKSCPVFDYKSVLRIAPNGYRVTKSVKLGPNPNGYPTVQITDQGQAVALLQGMLNKNGTFLVVDGLFGQATRAAVRSFQSLAGLEVDGIVGPMTWAALEASPIEG